ncbi:protease modulator HflC [bacterium]|nr:protease modulator HflC [candidate division CSSED10-310 bacterium]
MNRKHAMAAAITVAVIVLLIMLCVYTVKEDEFVVITSFGKPGVIHRTPGLYVKWPTPFSLVNRMDRKLQAFETPMIEYLTGDKKNLLIKSFIFWRINEPLLFFQAVHDQESAQQKLDDVVCSLVASTLGEHQISQLISTDEKTLALKEIVSEIETGAQVRIAPYGIEIETVGFSRLALPDDNTRSVYRRMIAERSSIANEYRAQGRQQAEEIRAEADRQRSDILAVANRDSEIIRGQADAEAAEIYGVAYAENPEFFRFLRTLETERKVLSEKSTVILSMDSELFEPIGGADR